jgi:transcription elongation factor Elf1
MDVTFHCPHCQQELVVDATGAGSMIICPTCEAEISIPEPEVPKVPPINAISSSAAAKEVKHFKVPVRDAPSEVLIKARVKSEEEEGDGQDKKLRLKTFRHSEHVEVGVDNYEKAVPAFLNKIGEENIISMTPLTYTHLDLATEKLLQDYALQVIYRR